MSNLNVTNNFTNSDRKHKCRFDHP